MKWQVSKVAEVLGMSALSTLTLATVHSHLKGRKNKT